MKVAVSIPDPLFEEAERLAERLARAGVTRMQGDENGNLPPGDMARSLIRQRSDPAGVCRQRTITIQSNPILAVTSPALQAAVAQQLGVLDEVSGLLSAARLAAAGQLDERFASVCRGVGEHLAVVTGLPRPDRWREVRPAQVDQLSDQFPWLNSPDGSGSA